MELTQQNISSLAGIIAEQIVELSSNVRWLKLKPAARYSAIGTQKLKRLADDGVITGFPDPDSGRGDWIFDRRSIDSYRAEQSKQLQEKILDCKRRVDI
jgi:hypothetical protein